MRADRYIKLPLRKNIFGVVTVLCLLFACSKNSMDTPASVDCSASKSFATEVNPIIQTSCATDSDCHGSGSSSGPGELRTYSQIFNARATIRTAVESGVMPKDRSLSSSEKNTILCWIDNGAGDN